MLQKVQFDILYNIVPAILLRSLPLAIRSTFWFHNPCNIREKCCVASASKNVPCVAEALPEVAALRNVSQGNGDYLINCSLFDKLLVPRTEHHLSSFKCGFLNIFSRQNLLRSLSRLLFLQRWNKYGAKKMSEKLHSIRLLR